MQRRKFIHQIAWSAGALALMTPTLSNALSLREKDEWHRMLASGINHPEILFPKEKRIPLGWKAFPVPATSENSSPTILKFPKVKSRSQMFWLRVTAAIDFREEVVISAFLPRSGE